MGSDGLRRTVLYNQEELKCFKRCGQRHSIILVILRLSLFLSVELRLTPMVRLATKALHWPAVV
jgi:hypothetical protein